MSRVHLFKRTHSDAFPGNASTNQDTHYS